jgi:cystathionine beta-lyase
LPSETPFAAATNARLSYATNLQQHGAGSEPLRGSSGGPRDDVDAPRSSLQLFGLENLSRRRSEKWARAPEGAIALGVAEMDFPLAPPIKRVLADLVERSDLGYPTGELAGAVRESFASRWRTRHGAPLDPRRVVLATDVVQAIHLCLSACSDEGAGVLALTPAYPPFFSAIGGTGRRLVGCDLVPTADGYRVDLEAVRRAAFDGGASVLLLCNPHNPTGRVLDRVELEGLAELACDLGLLVIADEIHADLVLEGRHVPIASLGDEIAARTVTLGSASKGFNLAGLRCACAAFGSDELLAAYGTVPSAQRGSVGLPGLLATLTAFEEGDAWLADVVGYLRANRDVVAATVGEQLPAVGHRPPQGTYLAWLDLRACRLGDSPAPRLAASGILLADGPAFGAAGRGHARLNFATPRPVLVEALRRLVEACRAAAEGQPGDA